MFKGLKGKKAAALLIVLGVILVVVFLANIVLQIMLNQSKLTSHQVGRIQAYYASNAGIIYAFEKLRTGDFEVGTHCYNASCEHSFVSGGPSPDFYPPLIGGNKTRIFILNNGDTRESGKISCSAPDGSACIIASTAFSTD